MSKLSEVFRFSLNHEYYLTLNRDMHLFDFSNVNILLNTILVNYFEDYYHDLLKVKNHVLTKLKKKHGQIEKSALSALIDESITEFIADDLKIDRGATKRLSIRISKDFKPKFTAFLKDLNIDERDYAVSFRNTIISYSKLSNTQRERILLKETYHLIETSIKNKSQLTFYINNKSYTVNPLLIVKPFDDLYLFLITQDGNALRPIPINKIKRLNIESKRFVVDDKTNTMLKNIKETGFNLFNKEIRTALSKLFNIFDSDEMLAVLKNINSVPIGSHLIKIK